MSIALLKSQLEKVDLKKIQQDLTLSIFTTRRQDKRCVKKDYIYNHDKEYVYLPFAYGKQYTTPATLPLIKTEAKHFTGQLRDQQTKIATKSLFLLQEQQSVILSAFTVAGKTVMALYLADVLQTKTLILTNKLMLIN